MSEGFSIDLGSALPYIVDSVLGIVGKDAASVEWKGKLNQMVKLSAQQASMVQCVGMPQPIPISQIYQKTTIRIPPRGRIRTIESLIESKEDAVIFAGPGGGKTTLLHWTYMRLCESKQYIPLLFTLRWPDAIQDLETLVEKLQRGRDVSRNKHARIILLVDGYDEIKQELRQAVSKSLMLFASLSLGSIYLTCRSHYIVYDLKCPNYELGPFSKEDARRFIAAYSGAYGSEVDAPALLKELEDHHLGEFARHPLMLTLVCILKGGPSKEIPRRAIGLLRRAIDTLTFRWDEAKAVHRESAIPLDGDERVRCLMRVAFDMDTPQVTWDIVRRSVDMHLSLLQIKGVGIRQLLDEMARFYGILVPADNEHWQFVHRTIHDYLSARFWVESGRFRPEAVGHWDIHAAYAACLTTDATVALELMLREDDISAFVECLYNTAPFQSHEVAIAVLNRIIRTGAPKVRAVGKLLRATTPEDFYTVSSDEFLRVLLKTASEATGRLPLYTAAFYNGDEVALGARALVVCAMAVLFERKAKIRAKHLRQFEAAVCDDYVQFECHLPDRTITFSSQDLIAAPLSPELDGDET